MVVVIKARTHKLTKSKDPTVLGCKRLDLIIQHVYMPYTYIYIYMYTHNILYVHYTYISTHIKFYELGGS